MKIVQVSNFALESYAEKLIAENIFNEDFANTMCEALNDKFVTESGPDYYRVEKDDYKLWRGMEELV
jgi:hypothetical protein